MAYYLTRSLLSLRALNPLGGSIRAFSNMYTATCTATGGRDGQVVCDDDRSHLDVKLTKPKQMGGSGVAGTNPEELFAAGYSACFLAAMGLAAQKLKTPLPKSSSVSAAVTIGKHDNGNFGFKVDLTVKIPNAKQEDADAITKAAHYICPYSHATRNNVEVNIKTTI
ncbi:unnamed protein product [Rotaria socialis]|uniref:Organic hydroperoxide resistance protein n=1 Tax=Rotaria socialis TaxID=392032 RepID=A0A819ZKW7_9BILA|nr:unnamed protein product [Rotaria socialis]CAF3515179.1 unnamed protein product [Rotaria socialis]CAF3568730.1 unnamed protein product [Rotaria socialis]CAF3732533.1 unnamed protein product [Rotaria socialis]CAF4172440.1 unnamed protein product [Rotaria socialis]